MSWYEEGKKNLFEVPEGYFDELPQRIQRRIEAKKKGRPWYARLQGVLMQPRWAVSVSVAVLAALVFWFSPNSTKHERMIQNIDDQILIEYLSHEVPSSRLIEEVPEDEWEEIMGELEIEQETWKYDGQLPAEEHKPTTYDSIESSTRQL
ncbi:hypothetical protein [Thermonema rossianum]|uniref:hypothetical protein n=1 Tax=Thermonema rossianum TaxID=55505 RepID=UPI00057145CF|nr:hypothetical protein [Thermonema rossianum]